MTRDGLAQTLGVEGLPKPAGRAHLPRFLLGEGVHRAHDDGNLGERSVPELLLPKAPSVHHRHRHVEEDYARFSAAAQLFERPLPVRRVEDLR